MESVDFSIAGTGIKVKRAEPVCVSAETCKASKACARGRFLFFLESKKPERHALRLEEFGLQFALQNGIDDDMADGEVVLHRSGEDIGGFNADSDARESTKFGLQFKTDVPKRVRL